MKTTKHDNESGPHDLRSDEPAYCWIDPFAGNDSNDGSFEHPVRSRDQAMKRLPNGREIFVGEQRVRIVPAEMPPMIQQFPSRLRELVKEAIAEGSSWREMLVTSDAKTNDTILLVQFVPSRLVVPLLNELKPHPGKFVCFTPRDWRDVPEEFRPSLVGQQPCQLEAANEKPDNEKCKRCNGSGYDPTSEVCEYGAVSACRDCEGSGKAIDWAEYWHDYDERYGVR